MIVTPRFLSLVQAPSEMKHVIGNGPLFFLGEIPNMPGHCLVVDGKGRVLNGGHIERYIEVPEEEV